MWYSAGLWRFNKSPSAVIPAGWESSMTERHTDSLLPHSKAMELQNDPTLMPQAPTHIPCVPYGLYMAGAFLQTHCSGMVNQAKLESYKKVGTPGLCPRRRCHQHSLVPTAILSLLCISHTPGTGRSSCQGGERSSDLDESASSHIFHPLTNHSSCTTHVPIHHRWSIPSLRPQDDEHLCWHSNDLERTGAAPSGTGQRAKTEASCKMIHGPKISL